MKTKDMNLVIFLFYFFLIFGNHDPSQENEKCPRSGAKLEGILLWLTTFDEQII
jgi:hypothetical protein